jgi:hypothetical protein
MIGRRRAAGLLMRTAWRIARRPPHSNFEISGHNKASPPTLYIFVTKQAFNASGESRPAWLTEPNQQDSTMSARSEPADIREIEVLSDEKMVVELGSFPDFRIAGGGQPFVARRMNVVAEQPQAEYKPPRKILIQLDIHAM